MSERPTWVVCRHVMDGSSPLAIVRPNGLCACKECIDDASIMETQHIHIVEEDRLVGMLKDVKTVQGMRYLKKG